LTTDLVLMNSIKTLQNFYKKIVSYNKQLQ
jgi:hypothetical protein